MRVPTITTYNSSTYMLSSLTSDLQNANEVVSTQKKLIEISDDPIGLNQVLTMSNTLGNLEQIEQNVVMGKSWLENVETALGSINDLILEVKTEATRLANDSTTADERSSAVERINNLIEQVVTLGNSQVNGSYIFGGTDTDIIPLEYDQSDGMDRVIYNGNHTPFEIRTDKNSGVEVGRDGEETFWDDEIQINSLNNMIVFKEDIGRGSAFEKTLTAVVPDGTYTAQTLETAVRNELNRASSESGYNVNYQVEYDADLKKYTIQSDGSYNGFIQTTFLWENSGDAYLKNMTVGDGIDPDDLNIMLLNKEALTLSTTESGETKPMQFVWDGDDNWIVKDNPGYIIPLKITGTAHGFELDLDESGTTDIRVTLENPALLEGAYVAFEIVPETGDYSIGHEIGFTSGNTISTPPVSDTYAQFITDLTITGGVNDTIDYVETRPPTIIAAGTVLNADYTIATSTPIISGAVSVSTFASGSVIASGTTLGVGSLIGSGITLVSDVTIGTNISGISSGTLVRGSALGSGTILGSGSILISGTTIGSGATIGSGTTITANIILGQTAANVTGGSLQSGSSLSSGSILGAGTLLNSGTIIGSGTVLAGDVQVAADITAVNGGILTAGSFVASGSTLISGTILANGEQISLRTGLNSGIVTGDGVSTLAQLTIAAPMGAAASYTVVSGGDTLNQGVLSLASGSVLAYGTVSGIVASGSTFAGVQVTAASGVALSGGMTLKGANLVLTSDTALVAGTTLFSGSTLLDGSSANGTGIVNSNAVLTLSSDMTTQGVTTLNGSTANNVLNGDLTIVAGTTLATGSNLINGSTLSDGAVTLGRSSTLAADLYVTGATGVVFVDPVTLVMGSTLASGSLIASGMTLGAGSIIGSGITLVSDVTTGRDLSGISSGTLVSGSSLGSGTILGSGSVLISGTTLGSGAIIGSGTTITANIILGQTAANVTGGLLQSGSSLISGSVLGAGTLLNSGTIIGSGTVLAGDVQTATDITAANGGILTAGSFVASGSTLISGTILASGEQISLRTGLDSGAVTGDGISTLAQLTNAAPMGAAAFYTVISGGDLLNQGILNLASGSVLAYGIVSGVVASGSIFTGVQVTASSGVTLNGAMTLNGADVVLTSDTTLMAGTSLITGSTLLNGSSVEGTGIVNSNTVITLNSDMTTEGVTTLNGPAANNVLNGDLTIVAGTTLASRSTLLNGSVVNDGAITVGINSILNADLNVTGATGVVLGADTTVLSGTIIAANSTLESGSVVNQDLNIDAAALIAAGTVFSADYGIASTVVVGSGTLAADTDLEAGSTIVSGSILGAGTVFGSGIVLTSDFQVATDIHISNSGTLQSGSLVPIGSTLTAGTILASGEQINLSNASGTTAIISGDGLTSLAGLASGLLGAEASYSAVSGDTLSAGIVTLASGSILQFSAASGLVTSGSSFVASRFTTSSGSTLNADLTVQGEGLTLGTNMTVVAGTTLIAQSVIAQGSSIDVTATTGGVSAELTATITAGNYADMDALCLEIQTQLEDQSANNVTYAVSYDPETSLFNIREDGTILDGLDLLWKSGTHSGSSIGSTLGYYNIDDSVTYPETDNAPVQCSITIDETNDILDFEEVNGAGISSGTLRAFISHGTYTSMADLLNKIETSMETVSDNAVDYDVSYDDNLSVPRLTIQSMPGTLNELRLFHDSGVDSIKETLGFDTPTTGWTSYNSDTAPVLMEFNSGNNKIDFRETNIDGITSETVSIEIPNGNYTDLDDVAFEIQTALKAASPNTIDYDVSYEFGTGKFVIQGSDTNLASYSLLWKSGSNSSESAAQMLGFDATQDDTMGFAESDKAIVNINIDATNNKIDFQELTRGNTGKRVDSLTASIEQKTYTSYLELAQEIEEALESESHINGNDIDYSITWDEHTNKFTFKENGTRLEEFRILWHSGDNAPVDQGGTGFGIGPILGFDGKSDDIKTPLSSTREVNWGIFNTLIDLKQYLTDNDRSGIERTIGRLETNYDNMTSRIVDSGMKYNRLEVRQTITKQVSLSLTERRSAVEDADIVESIMELQSIQLAYQAAMSSSAKIMNMSLLDYL